jgi:all-trans-8'-apo-beta-carotenal 15,15'-oxygenase
MTATALSLTPTAATPTAADHVWQRAFADLPRQHGFEPLRIEGRLPDGLSGTLYRTGPSLFSSFGRRYRHWFDGDGAVSAVRFDGGGAATGAVRLVQSQGLREERRRGRSHYAAYGTRAPSLLRGLMIGLTNDIKNTGNTSVMIWQGRLYAMVESSAPTELSVDDLQTIGESRLDGALVHSFSAHPHYVPQRKSAYNFGVRYGKQTMLDLYALPDEGQARHLGAVELPGATMIHDFIATERYLIFFAPPLRLRILKQLLGLGAYSENLRWQPEHGTEVIVVPIDRPTEVRRFTVPAFYQWHFANAYERGEELVVDYIRYPDFGSNDWLGRLPNGRLDGRIDGQLHRTVIDPERRQLRDEPLGTLACEFPRVAQPSKAHSAVYAAAYSSAEAAHGMFDRLVRFDVAAGQGQLVDLGAGRYPSEPVFVRRPDSRAADDGWLLSLVYDGVADQSGVAVLDARDLGRGPLAFAWYDHHVPFSFHGNFAR